MSVAEERVRHSSSHEMAHHGLMRHATSPRPGRGNAVRRVLGAGVLLAAMLPVAASASVTPPASTSPTPAARLAQSAARAATVVAPRVRALAAPSGFLCRRVRAAAVTLACTLGRSVDGRPLVAERQGNPTAKRVLVVIGQMHGEEWPGPLTVDVLRTLRTPVTATYAIWTVRSMNPDGGAIGRRFNSHGVNLNANFPNKFVPGPRAGRRALSEPESRAIARFLTWIQPDLVISLHGFSTAVDTTGGGRRASFARSFSRLSRILPAHVVPCGGPCHGNMTDWYTATSKVSGVAFTVEMPRTSRVAKACGVPGHPRGTTLQCAAWAAAYLAPRLPA